MGVMEGGKLAGEITGEVTGGVEGISNECTRLTIKLRIERWKTIK